MATLTTASLNVTQILTGQDVDLVFTVAEDGTNTDIGTLTVGIVDGNGVEVVAAGTAVTDNNNGTYAYTLSAVDDPDHLKVTLTEAGGTVFVFRVEVVGNLLFTETQARAFNAKADATDALVPLKNASEYTDAMISVERQRITDEFEKETGRGWIPRYARLELRGSNTYYLDLSKGICRTADGYMLNRPGRFNDVAEILSVTVGGTSVAVDNFEIDETHRKLIRTDTTFVGPDTANPFNVVVEYVYGLPYLVDGVDRAALRELVDRLVPSTFTDRALTVDSEYGTVRLVNQGGPMRNFSRVPSVNQWVASHDNRIMLG